MFPMPMPLLARVGFIDVPAVPARSLIKCPSHQDPGFAASLSAWAILCRSAPEGNLPWGSRRHGSSASLSGGSHYRAGRNGWATQPPCGRIESLGSELDSPSRFLLASISLLSLPLACSWVTSRLGAACKGQCPVETTAIVRLQVSRPSFFFERRPHSLNSYYIPKSFIFLLPPLSFKDAADALLGVFALSDSQRVGRRRDRLDYRAPALQLARTACLSSVFYKV